MEKSHGVVFVAFGQRYINLAFQAARSLRDTNPLLEVDLFTEAEIPRGPFDRIHVLPSVWVRSKLDAMRYSRFDRTLFLDADLLVVADISDIFHVLDRFDFALVHDQNRNGRAARVEYKSTLPNAFPQLNAGVFAYKKSGEVNKFLDAWRAAVIDHAINKDQPSLRELLWETDLRFTVLPPEYNLWNLEVIDYLSFRKHAAPRIVHSNLFVHTHPPKPGIDVLGHYIGHARAYRLRLLLQADRTLPRPAGVTATVPKWGQKLWLAVLYAQDSVTRAWKKAVAKR